MVVLLLHGRFEGCWDLRKGWNNALVGRVVLSPLDQPKADVEPGHEFFGAAPGIGWELGIVNDDLEFRGEGGVVSDYVSVLGNLTRFKLRHRHILLHISHPITISVISKLQRIGNQHQITRREEPFSICK